MALAALSGQGAALYDHYLHLLRFDDALAELASRRGLLVRFHISSARAQQARVHAVLHGADGMVDVVLRGRLARLA